MDDHCSSLAKVDKANFGLSIILLFGILISYLPQHVRIILRRSSYGISPWFVLLGMTSGTSAFANILVLPMSRADMACCREIDGFPCFAALLGVAQLGMQWACFAFILLLFLIFFPGATPSTNHPAKDETAPSFRTALIVAAACAIHGILVAALSMYFVIAAPWHLQSWANALGVCSAVLASIQYFPQIYTTYLLKSVESLSIPMMCIQTPGSFVWAASLAMRLGPSGWSAWGIYIVTGCLQGTLLVMGSYFELKKSQEEKDRLQGRITDAQGDDAPSERTPLIREEE